MSKYYKDLAGPHFETLSKAIYDKTIQRVVDPSELYMPLLVLPRSIVSWLVANISGLEAGQALKELPVPGREDHTLRIRKVDNDQYSGDIVHKGKIIHNFGPSPLPTVGGVLLHVCSLYDEIAGRKVEDVEKRELAEQAQQPSLKDVMDKLGLLLDKISESEKMRKEELDSDKKKIEEAKALGSAAPQPAPGQQPVVVNINLSDIGNISKPESVKDDSPPKKEAPAEEPIKVEEIKPEDIKKEELDKAGVHEAKTKYMAQHGVSRAGEHLRDANFYSKEAHMPSSGESHLNHAKKEHKRVLSELKDQPKPDLPKSEPEPQKAGEGRLISKQDLTGKIKELSAKRRAEKGTLSADRPEKYNSARARAEKILAGIRKSNLEKAAMKGAKAPEIGQKGMNQAPQAASKPQAPKQGSQLAGMSVPKDTAASMPSIARQPAAFVPPKVKTPTAAKAPAMKPSIPGVKKEELDEAVSDSGKKLFVREGNGYIFNPTGSHAVMTKGSMEIKKSEDGTFSVYLDRNQWDEENIQLLSTILKAKKLLAKYGF